MALAIVAVDTVSAIAAIAIVALAIAVLAIATITSVAAVLAIAIVIAILLLRHVDAVEDDGHLRQFLLGIERIDEVEALLRRVVGTAHVDGCVGNTANLQSISHQANRSRVDEHIVVVLTQMLEDDLQRRAGDELGGVGGNRTGEQQVEVVVDARGNDLVLHHVPCGSIVGEQRGDAMLVVVDLEQFGQTRLTNVKTNEDDLLAQQGEAHGQVGSVEGLTLTRCARREEDDLLIL